MDRHTCELCEENKTALRCSSCGSPSCKNCVEFIDEDQFEMIDLLPDDLKNKTFCRNCYQQGVAERVNRYLELVERAKDVNVFSKNQTKESRKIIRREAPVLVKDCQDKGEALLKLAFLTADKGFDTIVDVELSSHKVGEGKSYKKLVWSGRGIPVDPKNRKK